MLLLRVFTSKLTKLTKAITQRNAGILGKKKTRANTYTVEWQKRDLPHAHSVFWLENKIYHQDIDTIVKSEVPDPNVYEIIRKQMVHCLCGTMNPHAPCMKNNNGQCEKGYPEHFMNETKTEVQ